MRYALGLIALAACGRAIDNFATDSVVPAFLGDFSGLYLPSTGASQVGAALDVVQIAGQLIIAPPSVAASNANQFTIVGPLLTTANGHQQVVSSARLPLGGNGALITVPVTVDLGLDALTMTFTSLDAAHCFFSTSGVCALVANKSCDFDSRLAGVFDTTVTRRGQSGDCSASISLAGPRQWALTAVNGGNEASFTSVKGTQIEFALLLDFAHANESLSLDRALPIAGQLNWADTSSFSGTTAITDSSVVFNAAFTRVLDSGCSEEYQATGTRQSGTKPNGISCPTAANGCPDVAPPICPALPADLASYDQTSALDGNGCVESSTCVGTINACPGVDSVTAAVGCKSSQTVVVSNNAGCASLVCTGDSLCNDSVHAPRNSVGADYCDAGDQTLVTVDSYDCTLVNCVSPDPACPNRAPPCAALGISGAALTLSGYDDNGCPELACALGAGLDTSAFFKSSLATLASTYVIQNFSPSPGTAGQESMPVLAAATLGCDPLSATPGAGQQYVLSRKVLSDGVTTALCFAISE